MINRSKISGSGESGNKGDNDVYRRTNSLEHETCRENESQQSKQTSQREDHRCNGNAVSG